ncbi:hypothetical protein CGMCC3_g13069 [Colletotrichum fructicola]|nr:uncharacterized protein CGMCC3_g13069 [Colletotrichum fructicola]KAE9570828.1 hypothetical protein CGMCC3_g13069 [Colletotrichum fructicola]
MRQRMLLRVVLEVHVLRWGDVISENGGKRGLHDWLVACSRTAGHCPLSCVWAAPILLGSGDAAAAAVSIIESQI